MRIDFHALPERTMPGMNGGTGTMSARMYVGPGGKIIPTTLHAGGSIGLHGHPTSDELDYVLSGSGLAVCDGEEEPLGPGVCTYAERARSTAWPTPGPSRWSC